MCRGWNVSPCWRAVAVEDVVDNRLPRDKVIGRSAELGVVPRFDLQRVLDICVAARLNDINTVVFGGVKFVERRRREPDCGVDLVILQRGRSSGIVRDNLEFDPVNNWTTWELLRSVKPRLVLNPKLFEPVAVVLFVLRELLIGELGEDKRTGADRHVLLARIDFAAGRL